MIQSHKHKRITVPPLLKQIPDPPKQLFCLGDSLGDLLKLPRVAIVGSRQMSPYGKAVTWQLATKLAGQGIVVVSGLAYGVDACAQEAALAAGGSCLSVQGNGLDRLYPSANRVLGERIVQQGGAIISEYPPGTKPRKHYFLERNRLVAGLADTVIITEAAARSGTLNTATHALNQGKPVFAVPGNISNPLSEGTNNLIKAGATPLLTVDDVFDCLHIPKRSPQPPKGSTPEEETILQLLFAGTEDGSKLFHDSQLPIAVFNQTITMLEITGKIRALGNNQWSLAP